MSTLVTSGHLRRASRGVFVSSATPDTFEQRLAVACAITGGVVMYPTAGVIWKIRKTPASRDLHVWVDQARRVTAPQGVRIHRTTHLPRTDIVRRGDGINVTSPPRTAFDAAATLDAETLESLIEQGMARRWYTIPTLWGTGRRLCGRGRAGSGLFAAVLNGRPAWKRPADSDHEIRLERAMRARGFPHLVRQHRIELCDGIVIHPDLGIPTRGFYVEVDHVTWHGGRYESAYDKKRDMKVRAQGLFVERVSDIALDNDLEETIEDLWANWQLCLARGLVPVSSLR